MSLGGGARLPRATPTSARSAAPGSRERATRLDKHRVSFTGSGGDYFKLWLSNLLLTIVTLGIYTPWARRRRIQYFFRNTEVGPDPLDFTASSRSMVTSFILVALVYVLFKVMSSQGLNTAVSALMLLLAAATPWLWRSAVRFRLGNTDWRGMPFEFQASVRETYVAAWPLLGVALLMLLPMWLLPATPEVGAKPPAPSVMFWVTGVGAMLLAGVIFIRLRFNFLQLQMTRTALGGQMGQFKASFGDFFKVGLICLGIGVLAYLLLSGFLVGFAAGFFGAFRTGSRTGAGIGLMLVLVFFLFIPLLLVPASITLAAWEALVFRTVWSNAGLANMARSKCNLQTRAFVWLRTKNVFLTLLTLGLYRPFAAVSEYRMKIESVRVYTRGDINALANMLSRSEANGLGDAAADLAGFDLAV